MSETRTFQLDKLVRDDIVELTEEAGGSAEYHVVEGEDLIRALIDKLIEEAKELKSSGVTAGELSDMQEVIDQIRENSDISRAELDEAQKAKRERSGGFEKGHFVHTVTLPADSFWANYYAADPIRFPEIIEGD